MNESNLIQGMSLEDTGIPTRIQVLSTYCQYSQRHYQTQQQQQRDTHAGMNSNNSVIDSPVPPSSPQLMSFTPSLSPSPIIHPANLNEAKKWSGFYLSFLFFKNCVIVHGVAQRASLGVASSEMAHRVAKLLPEMVRLTWKILSDFPPPYDDEKDGEGAMIEGIGRVQLDSKL